MDEVRLVWLVTKTDLKGNIRDVISAWILKRNADMHAMKLREDNPEERFVVWAFELDSFSGRTEMS